MSKRNAKTPRRSKAAAAPATVSNETVAQGEQSSAPAKALVLRTCTADLTSPAPEARGFRWPASGLVEAPDWNPMPECGHGLHGALWGEGKGGLFCWDADAKWLVVEVELASIVDLDGKVKFPRGEVVFCGDRSGATAFLAARAPGRAIIGSTATAGDRGTATAGENGTATAGENGTATAGENGTVAIRYWDPKGERYRVAIGCVGEDGIEPGTAYIVDEGKLRKKEQQS